MGRRKPDDAASTATSGDDADRPHLRLERPAEQAVAVVIDRPAMANALSVQFFDELSDALDLIERDDSIRVWLLTGAPRPDGRPWFSSGADMSEALSGSRSVRANRPATNPGAVIDR